MPNSMTILPGVVAKDHENLIFCSIRSLFWGVRCTCDRAIYKEKAIIKIP